MAVKRHPDRIVETCKGKHLCLAYGFTITGLEAWRLQVDTVLETEPRGLHLDPQAAGRERDTSKASSCDSSSVMSTVQTGVLELLRHHVCRCAVFRSLAHLFYFETGSHSVGLAVEELTI